MKIKGIWIVLLIALAFSVAVKVYVSEPESKKASDYFKDETSKIKVDDGAKF